MSGLIQRVFVSTDYVEPRARTDFWREVSRPFAETLPLERGGELEGMVHAQMVGGALMGITAFNAQRYVRSRRTILQTEVEMYTVNLFLEGTMQGNFNQRDVSVEPGDIFITDLTQPFESQVDAGRRLSIYLPRQALEKTLHQRSLHGCVLKAGQPMTRILFDYIKGLNEVAPQLSPREGLVAQEAMTSLLVSSLEGRDWGDPEGTTGLRLALRQRVFEFIDAHLAEPELGPEMLMRRFRVSRTHLYRAFEEDGGVARVIRSKRLDAAYLSLVRQSGSARLSIEEMAYRAGFSSSAQFLRGFRARFSTTPSEARRVGLPSVPSPPQSRDMHQHLESYGLGQHGAAARLGS